MKLKNSQQNENTKDTSYKEQNITFVEELLTGQHNIVRIISY